MTAPPTTTELRQRLINLAADINQVPPERRTHLATLIDRCEQLVDTEPQLWAY